MMLERSRFALNHRLCRSLPRRSRIKFVHSTSGSGVALLMELAHHMKKLPTNVGVDFVFFDGEEYVFDPRGDEYFFGSKYFAENYRKMRKQTEVIYHGAILLDMIAGKNLRLPVEQNSNWSAPALVKDVYRVAADVKAGSFKADEMSKFAVEDDHIALNRNGIPAIDLIDFEYKHWHCLSDLPEIGRLARHVRPGDERDLAAF